MSEQFYSEDGVDEWLAKSGLLPKTGIWVDCGCAHPLQYSQTAFLRNRGWTGIAIDGDIAYSPEWAQIERAKFVHAVLSDKSWEHFLREPTNALVSRVHAEGTGVPAFKLQQVLDVCGVTWIDFLSLDLEGMEMPVLRSFLMSRTRDKSPKVIMAEFNSCHAGRDVSLFNMMPHLGYKLIHLTDCNAVFAINESSTPN